MNYNVNGVDSISDVNGISNRISVHDTEIESLKNQVGAIFNKLDHIESLISDSKKTNWGLIVSALGLGISMIGGIIVMAVAFNAARVTPLENAIFRNEAQAKTLADAVVIAQAKANQLSIQLAEHETQDKFTQKTLENYTAKGTPETDKRLMLLEYQMSELRKK